MACAVVFEYLQPVYTSALDRSSSNWLRTEPPRSAPYWTTKLHRTGSNPSTPAPSVNGIEPIGRAWTGGVTVANSTEPDHEGSGFETRGCHGVVYRT